MRPDLLSKGNTIRVIALASLCALAICACGTGNARAARGMEIALQDDPVFLGKSYFNRTRALKLARSLGVTRLRVTVNWAFTVSARNQRKKKKPKNLIYNFAGVDSAIDAAARQGIRVHVTLSGPGPAWATGNHKVSGQSPNVKEFVAFVKLAATHFKGRVDRYSIWNEPNWKTWLGPLRRAPSIYRSLYTRSYSAIKKADRKAKVLIGETAPYERRGLSTAPIAFLRKVLCLSSKYKKTRKCPGLKADGYAHHPYDFAHSPRFKYPGEDNATLGTLGNLTRALDRFSRARALRRNGGGRMPVYLTEYGYFASGHRRLPAKTRSKYLADGFQLALRNGRVKSQLQYLLVSPPKRFSWSFFDLGLVTAKGRKYPQFRALQRWYKRNRSKVKRPGKRITLPRIPVG
jgi:hypothetical protein